MTENKNEASRQILLLILGEIIVSSLVCLVYFLLGRFELQVILGTLLGSTVTVANFAVLAFSVNRAVDKYIELRGSREMSEEEAEAFAKEHSMVVQNAAMKSFILRTASMLAALVVAFLFTNLFSTLATAIPLLMFRPILYVLELIKSKGEKK